MREAKRVPDHCLVARNHRLTRLVFYALDYVERAQGTAGNKYRIGVFTILSSSEFGYIVWSYSYHIAIFFKIESGDRQNLETGLL